MRVAPALAISILLAIPAVAAAAPDGSIGLVDRPTGFGALPFDGVSGSDIGTRTISADGCFVAFESENDALLSGDENDSGNIFRKDRCSPGHPVEQVNIPADDTQPVPLTFADTPSISANGRFVAFETDTGGDGNERAFVKDMQTGSLTLVSRGDGANGAPAANVFDPTISGDGNRVAFLADGALDGANTDGVDGQTNVFVRDIASSHTYVASVKGDGTAGGGGAGTPDISFDGTAVAFVSFSQLVAGDTDGGGDAYLARAVGPTPTQTLVSFAPNTADADDASPDQVALSTDGKFVAWTNSKHPFETICDPACAPAANLDAGVDHTVTDGQIPQGISFGYSFSSGTPANPTHVFWATAAALTAGDTNGTFDIYAHKLSDLTLNGLSRVSSGTDPSGVQRGVASDDASLLLFRSRSPQLPGSNGAAAQVFVQSPGGTTNVSQPEGDAHALEAGFAGLNNLHAVGPNAQFTVFSSNAPGLGVQTSPTGALHQQVFLRNELTGDTTLVSRADDGAPADRGSDDASVDAAGDRVAFQSLASNLAPNVAPDFEHVYVRDLASGTTKLLDRTAGGAVSSNGATSPEISADGKTVVFTSSSPDLPDASPGTRHAYVADLQTGKLTVADTTQAGTPGDDIVFDVDVSADGSRVAFTSVAGNLGGSSKGHSSVYVKDLRDGSLTWASRPEDGNPDHTTAADLSFSADASHVAFVESEATFGFGANGTPHVFLHDLGSGHTELVSVATPGGLDVAQRRPSLNANASRITFAESSFGGNPTRTYYRDLVAGVTTPLETGPHGSSAANLDASGTCAAFKSSSPNLSDPGYPSPDFDHVYVRAIGGDCPHVATGPGTGSGGGGGSGTADATAPVISGLHVTHKRFRLATKRTALAAKRHKRGTTFVFKLSERARVTISIAKGSKHRVTLTRSHSKRGTNHVAFSGRTKHGRLRPGHYRATLRATDAAGNRSKARTVTFTVVRR
jgi:Tol biopolymer transport system component